MREKIATAAAIVAVLAVLGIAGRLDAPAPTTTTSTTSTSTTRATTTTTTTTTAPIVTTTTTAAVIGEAPAFAFVVDVPATPEDALEDASGRLATALIELGATATCPGECLVYVDTTGRVVWFRFTP